MVKNIATLILLLILVSKTSFATHLMGGDMTYKYLGVTGFNFNYEVTLKLYRYCSVGSSQLPNNMHLGVYEEDILNPAADKSLVGSYVMPLISQQFIMPPTSNTSCSFTTVVCIEEGVYIDTISVPASVGGYHLICDRCCRNNNIANLNNPSNDGLCFYAFIPPTNVVNNSPVFAAPPPPYFCQNDSAIILNTAYDIDRDSLAYSLVVPFVGISSIGNPNPNAPSLYTWPIPTAVYANTYSLAQPFGTGTYATIDSSTGISNYFANMQGYYVVAVEVREYRNGTLIGIIRRELQLIVIPCPTNPAPEFNGSGQTIYTVLEGQTLCFNPTFVDANGDSLFLTKASTLFDSLLFYPVATLPDTSGDSIVTSQFCWTTHVGQASHLPYYFSVIVNDKGCPSKTFNITYTIIVYDSASVGIHYPDKSNDIKLHPNPASDFFWIDYNVVNSTDNAELLIYNTLGEIVMRKSLYDHFKESKVNCSVLQNGIYYVALRQNNKTVSSGKFVKE